MSTGKSVPLTKDETSLLIQLVEGHKILTSKVTNATNNKLKEEAWSRIKDQFNAAVASCPRKTGQLRLKWDNLKKAARKRSAIIRMNELKTGGGKPDYIPPNDVLDRVAGILAVTCDGYKVPFDDDTNHQGPAVIDENAKVKLIDMSEVELESEVESEGSNSTDFDVYSVVSQNDTTSSQKTYMKDKLHFATPQSSAAKKRFARDELTKSSILRNNAVADYFIGKKNKMMQQNQDHKEEPTKLKEENLKLKEENIKLKEENIKLKEENIKLKEEDLKLKEKNIKLKEEDLKLKEENIKLKEEDLKLKEDNLNVRREMLNETINK